MTRCLFRPHDWEPREVYPITEYWESASELPMGHRTEVLYVCRTCGKPKVKKLKGRWTLDDVARR
jgi:hypothetical protein